MVPWRTVGPSSHARDGVLDRVPNPNWRSAASVGQGNWVTEPWCAVYDSRETTSAQKGAYPVIHFQTDDPTHLRVGWGVSLTEYGSDSQPRALQIAQTLLPEERDALGARGFQIATSGEAPTISSDEHVGTVLAKLVPRPSLDGDVSELTEDFRAILEFYKAWVERTTTPTPAEAPTPAETFAIPPRRRHIRSTGWPARRSSTLSFYRISSMRSPLGLPRSFWQGPLGPARHGLHRNCRIT